MIPIPAIIIIASGVLICAYLIIKMWANENKTDLVEMEETKMTENEAIKILEYIKSNLNDSQMFARHDEALDMAIKALEQQPCEDCVSRKDVLAMKRVFVDEDGVMAYAVPTGNILRLQSVTPTRPTGKWIDIQYFKADDTYYRPKCPFCSIEPKEYSNYCPNCGARMVESEDEA